MDPLTIGLIAAGGLARGVGSGIGTLAAGNAAFGDAQEQRLREEIITLQELLNEKEDEAVRQKNEIKRLKEVCGQMRIEEERWVERNGERIAEAIGKKDTRGNDKYTTGNGRGDRRTYHKVYGSKGGDEEKRKRSRETKERDISVYRWNRG